MRRRAQAQAQALAQALAVATVALLLAACSSNDAVDDHDDGHDHDREPPGPIAYEMDAEVVLHHWQALSAIQNKELSAALHHVEHILDAIDEADHVAEMEAIVDDLEAGNGHDAGHALELMLIGQAEPSLSEAGVHLQMALTAAGADNSTEALHHLQHVAESGRSDLHDSVMAIMDDFDAGNREAGIERLGKLVADVTAAGAMQMAGDDHDDSDGHHDDGAIAVSRTIDVNMSEFAYAPQEIRARVGEGVRLVVENTGAVLHDLSSAGFRGQVEVEGGTDHSDADHAHNADLHIAVNPGERGSLSFVAEAAGEFELICTVPGHHELGMSAVLIIEAAD